MIENDPDGRHAHTTAHIGYALVYALLNEMEKERPGFRKRVWLQAQQSLDEYGYLDQDSADWVAAKIASL